MLNHRLRSLPAKMLRSFVFTAGDLLAPDLPPLDGAALELLPVGRTGDILFNALELEVDTRVKAAQADDSGVDLTQWSNSEETPEVAYARSVLRRLAVHWWA